MFRDFLRARRRALGLAAAVAAVGAAVAWLYALPAEPVLYAAVLGLALGLGALAHDWAGWTARCRRLELLAHSDWQTLPVLPAPDDRLEADWQQLLRQVAADRDRLVAAAESSRRDLLDYYTMWLHQVKTPIAALGLLLDAEPTARADAAAELVKIEQYTGMALSYLRLEEGPHDLVLRRQGVDDILRGAVRRLTRLFVQKNIRLQFTETGLQAVTDEMWLGFAVEQLLTNALKYTPAGGQIAITPADGGVEISDTGIGIRPEDLPRVCEKGFTGCNGRVDRRATGLGLYLCSRALALLGHGMTITSTPGKGTTVRLRLTQRQTTYE